MKSKFILTTKTFLVLAAFAFGIVMLSVNSKSILADSSVNLSTPGAGKDGAKIYAMSCARCHGADGRAKTGKGKQTNAVDLTGDDWEPNDARDTRIINNGKGKMPGFKKSLKPEEIQSVVAYIRKFKG
jgi:mono/diheme cytochrome c family protein